MESEDQMNLNAPIPYTLTEPPAPITDRRTTLPDFGVWIVDTASETYEIDVEARLAVCRDLAGEGAGRLAEPTVHAFDVVECEVGQPLLFDAGSSPLAGDVVLGITAAVTL